MNKRKNEDGSASTSKKFKEIAVTTTMDLKNKFKIGDKSA